MEGEEESKMDEMLKDVEKASEKGIEAIKETLDKAPSEVTRVMDEGYAKAKEAMDEGGHMAQDASAQLGRMTAKALKEMRDIMEQNQLIARALMHEVKMGAKSGKGFERASDRAGESVGHAFRDMKRCVIVAHHMGYSFKEGFKRGLHDV